MSKRSVLLFILLLFSLPSLATVQIGSQLENIALSKKSAKDWSILCTLNAPFKYKVFVLHAPERVVIDFEQVQLIPNVKKLQFHQGIVTGFRYGTPKPQLTRLVFEVNQPAHLSVASWKPSQSNRFGLEIRIAQMPVKSKVIVTNKGPKAVAAVTSVSSPNKVTSQHEVVALKNSSVSHQPVRVKHEPPKTLRDVVIVLDPGHGGKDPGALGMRRNTEKQIVLAIALKLKQLIDRQPGMRAVLTRQGDYYIGLRQRLNIARKHSADIFVAIHADAYGNHQSRGASVFALSPRGATSEAARWLAEKENYSELGGVNLSDLDDRSGVIRTVLLDLSQTATISSSLKMGNYVLRRLDTMTNLHNNKVEQARFVVLKSPDIPSVLIETGFISNPYEEANLTNPNYQMRLARAIFEGLKGYFWSYPPHGTRIEAMSGVNRKLYSV